MTRDELLAKLQAIARDSDDRYDMRSDHEDADAALLAYINDPEIAAAFEAIEKWYA